MLQLLSHDLFNHLLTYLNISDALNCSSCCIILKKMLDVDRFVRLWHSQMFARSMDNHDDPRQWLRVIQMWRPWYEKGIYPKELDLCDDVRLLRREKKHRDKYDDYLQNLPIGYVFPLQRDEVEIVEHDFMLAKCRYYEILECTWHHGLDNSYETLANDIKACKKVTVTYKRNGKNWKTIPMKDYITILDLPLEPVAECSKQRSQYLGCSAVVLATTKKKKKKKKKRGNKCKQ